MAKKKAVQAPTEFSRLLDAIRDDPHSDAPYVAIADWLSAQDDEALKDRGEMIRLSMQASPLKYKSPERVPLDKRITELAVKHLEWGDWQGYFPSASTRYTFLLSTEAKATKFLRAQKVWELHPCPDLTLVEPGDKLAKALASTAMQGVRKLSFSGATLSDADAAVIAAAPLDNLRYLSLFGNQIGAAGVRALGKSTHLGRLHTLMIGNNALHDEGIAALSEATAWPNLRKLDVSEPQCAPKALGLLAAAPWFAGLTELSLCCHENAGISDMSVEAITSAVMKPGLRSLNLMQNKIWSGGAKMLAEWSALAPCEELLLYGNCIEAEGVEALAASPLLQNVKVLKLGKNPIGDPGAIALANSPHLHKVETLDLMLCEIGDAGLRALLDSPNLKSLKRVNLVNNPVTEVSGKYLLESEKYKRFEKLELFSRKLSLEMLAAMRGMQPVVTTG